MDPNKYQEFLAAAKARSQVNPQSGQPMTAPGDRFNEFLAAAAPASAPAAPASAPAPAPSPGSGGVDWAQQLGAVPYVGPALGMAATGLGMLYNAADGAAQPAAPATMPSGDAAPRLVQATPEGSAEPAQGPMGPPVLTRQVGGGGLPSSYRAAFGESRQGLDAEKAAVERQGEVLGQSGAEQADILGQAAVRLQATEMLQRDRAERQAAAEAEQIDRIGKAQQDYEEKASRGIQSYWSSRTSSQKALITISQALGAFGSALTKTPNEAFEMLQSDIQQDLQRQKAKIELARDKVDIRKNMLATLQQKYQLGEEREAVAEGLMWKSVQTQLGSIAAGSQGEEAKAKAAQLSAQIDQRLGALDLQIAQKTAAAAARSTQHLVPVNYNGQTVYVKMNDQQLVRQSNEQAKLGIEQQKAAAQSAPLTIPGYRGQAATKEVYSKLVDQTGELEKIRALVAQQKQIRASLGAVGLAASNAPGAGSLSSSVAALEANSGDIFNAFRKITQSGAALSPDETKKIEAIIGNAKNPLKVGDAQLDQVITVIERSVNKYAEKAGLRPETASGTDLGALGTVRGKVQ